MVVGSIYLHEKFKFSDGATGKKLFIAVNSPSKKENYLVCKTTSKERPPYRVKKQGCSAPKKNYFMFSKKDDWFTKDTWVQFDKIYEFEQHQLLQDRFDRQVEFKARLETKNIRALLNCILKSMDISERYSKSIKKTLRDLRKS